MKTTTDFQEKLAWRLGKTGNSGERPGICCRRLNTRLAVPWKRGASDVNMGNIYEKNKGPRIRSSRSNIVYENILSAKDPASDKNSKAWVSCELRGKKDWLRFRNRSRPENHPGNNIEKAHEDFQNNNIEKAQEDFQKSCRGGDSRSWRTRRHVEENINKTLISRMKDLIEEGGREARPDHLKPT